MGLVDALDAGRTGPVAFRSSLLAVVLVAMVRAALQLRPAVDVEGRCSRPA